MPIAKAVVARSPLPSGLIDTDQLTVVVVDVLRQLARLVAVCDVMFAELTTDVEDIRDRVTSLSTRTAKLAERLDTFDAVTVKVRTYTPTCTSTLCPKKRHYIFGITQSKIKRFQ